MLTTRQRKDAERRLMCLARRIRRHDEIISHQSCSKLKARIGQHVAAPPADLMGYRMNASCREAIGTSHAVRRFPMISLQTMPARREDDKMA